LLLVELTLAVPKLIAVFTENANATASPYVNRELYSGFGGLQMGNTSDVGYND
jgi:hypothetical protein